MAKKLTKREALYFSMILWEGIHKYFRDVATGARHFILIENIQTFKRRIRDEIHDGGPCNNIDDLVDRVRFSESLRVFACPCCTYVMDLEGVDESAGMNGHVCYDECPAIDIWCCDESQKQGFQEHLHHCKAVDGRHPNVPCEVDWHSTPYSHFTSLYADMYEAATSELDGSRQVFDDYNNSILTYTRMIVLGFRKLLLAIDEPVESKTAPPQMYPHALGFWFTCTSEKSNVGELSAKEILAATTRKLVDLNTKFNEGKITEHEVNQNFAVR